MADLPQPSVKLFGFYFQQGRATWINCRYHKETPGKYILEVPHSVALRARVGTAVTTSGQMLRVTSRPDEFEYFGDPTDILVLEPESTLFSSENWSNGTTDN